MILNSQNVLEASNQKGFGDLPDGFSIKFINEADGYLQTEVYVMANGRNVPQADRSGFMARKHSRSPAGAVLSHSAQKPMAVGKNTA